jgi:hypothetical protein
MGNLVTLTLYTDTIDEVVKNCEEFCNEVYGAINNDEASTLVTGNRTVGKIQVTRHSSSPTIYVQMGNTTDEMNPYSRDTERIMVEHPDNFQEMLKYMKKTVGELEKKFKKTQKGLDSELDD